MIACKIEFRWFLQELLQISFKVITVFISYQFKMLIIWCTATCFIIFLYRIVFCSQWFALIDFRNSSLFLFERWIESGIKWKPQNKNINNMVCACHSQVTCHVKRFHFASQSIVNKKMSLNQTLQTTFIDYRYKQYALL